jgi:hypothetical protein
MKCDARHTRCGGETVAQESAQIRHQERWSSSPNAPRRLPKAGLRGTPTRTSGLTGVEWLRMEFSGSPTAGRGLARWRVIFAEASVGDDPRFQARAVVESMISEISAR